MTNEPQKETTLTPEQILPPQPETAAAEQFPAMPAETAPEQLASHEETGVPARAEGFMEETIGSLRQKLHLSKKPKRLSLPIVRDQVTKQVEHLMEEGLQDAFKAMTPVQRQEFKIKGEATARDIRELLRSTKVKVKKIFKLILEWLKLIPGVNKFFLEQEAKIKADQIIALKKMNSEK